jgi:hypothetical protein
MLVREWLSYVPSLLEKGARNNSKAHVTQRNNQLSHDMETR